MIVPLRRLSPPVPRGTPRQVISYLDAHFGPNHFININSRRWTPTEITYIEGHIRFLEDEIRILNLAKQRLQWCREAKELGAI